jgi:hypothetical protein
VFFDFLNTAGVLAIAIAYRIDVHPRTYRSKKDKIAFFKPVIGHIVFPDEVK